MKINKTSPRQLKASNKYYKKNREEILRKNRLKRRLKKQQQIDASFSNCDSAYKMISLIENIQGAPEEPKAKKTIWQILTSFFK